MGYKGDRPLRSAREERERERTEPDRPTDDHRVTMKTSRALALAALGALAVSGAVHCEPSVLDGERPARGDHAGAHQACARVPGGDQAGHPRGHPEGDLRVQNYPELEALTVAESYFENPETS